MKLVCAELSLRNCRDRLLDIFLRKSSDLELEVKQLMEKAGVLIVAGNSCPQYGSSLAEDWDPSRILPLKQRTGGVVPEVLNRPAMGCDPFGIGSGIGQRTVELRAAKASSAPNPEGSKPVAPG